RRHQGLRGHPGDAEDHPHRQGAPLLTGEPPEEPAGGAVVRHPRVVDGEFAHRPNLGSRAARPRPNLSGPRACAGGTEGEGGAQLPRVRRLAAVVTARPVAPATTHGIGISPRTSSESTTSPANSAQTATRPAKAMPITRCPVLTGCRHRLGVLPASVADVGSVAGAALVASVAAYGVSPRSPSGRVCSSIGSSWFVSSFIVRPPRPRRGGGRCRG